MIQVILHSTDFHLKKKAIITGGLELALLKKNQRHFSNAADSDGR
jgi:hypothetical protein